MKVGPVEQLEFLERMASDARLCAAALRVGVLLTRLYHGDHGFAWPAHSTIAERLHLNERTVRRGLDQLEAAGWYKVEGRGGGHNPCKYYPQWRYTPGETARSKGGRNGPVCPEQGGQESSSGRANPSDSPGESVQQGGRNGPTSLLSTPLNNSLKSPLSGADVPRPLDFTIEALRLWTETAKRIGAIWTAKPDSVWRLAEHWRPKFAPILSIFELDGWRDILAAIEESKPMHGSFGFVPDLDFLLDEFTCQRILDGAFRVRSAERLIDAVSHCLQHRAGYWNADYGSCIADDDLRRSYILDQDLPKPPTPGDALVLALIKFNEKAEPSDAEAEILPPEPKAKPARISKAEREARLDRAFDALKLQGEAKP